MKYLVLIALALLALWWWRSLARRASRSEQPPARTPSAPRDMVACRQCGLHLPGTDAVEGELGRYCSTAHRRAAEGQ